MKKNSAVSLVIVFLLAALAVSCSKSAPETASAPQVQAPLAGAAPAVRETTAYVMLHKLSMWEKDGDKLKFKKSATIGDRVSILGEPEMLSSDGSAANKREYSLVKTADGEQFYMRTPYVVPTASLAVVVADKCVVYTEPRLINATKTEVPRYTLVAVLEPANSDGYMKVSFANPDETMSIEKWIKSDTVASGSLDVQAAVAYTVVKAMPEADKQLKINILEEAVKAYGGSALEVLLADTLLALRGVQQLELVAEKGFMAVTLDKVNVRSQPGDVGSEVLSQLNAGDMVEITERTSEQFTVGDKTAHWYHISSPVEGWVFGAFLTQP